MLQEQFFTNIDSQKLCHLIGKANESVIFASPGIWQSIASALVDTGQRIENEMVVVCLDVSEQTMRLGYGEIEAIETLESAGMIINHIEHLRFGLVIIDGKGFSFTPTALFLESEQSASVGFNAIKLTAEQVAEASARLSPAARAIAVAACTDGDKKQALESIKTEVDMRPVSKEVTGDIGKSLKNIPPAKFDLSRQVRVYSTYIQYVEISMVGAALQRQKVALPKVFQSLGSEKSDLQERLKTSFTLIEKGDALSSKSLEDSVNKLREIYTRPLGKKHGRVMLKSNRQVFDEAVKRLKADLVAHAKKVEESLESHIEKSITSIANYFLPIIQEDPPKELEGALGLFAEDDEQVLKWIKRNLYGVFPAAHRITNKMEITVIYKDVTYENLNEKSFIVSVKEAFPDFDWEKVYQESLAVSQSKEGR